MYGFAKFVEKNYLKFREFDLEGEISIFGLFQLDKLAY